MTRKYDKVDKDAFCEEYIHDEDTGSNGKIPLEKYKMRAREIFGSLDNFMNYLNSDYRKEEISEINENSKLIEIIDSVETKQVSPIVAKSKIKKLKKANFPFDKLDYKPNPQATSDIQSQNLFYVARRYVNDNLR